ncbi:LOW QUALITY PROTEIN: hypothetical protein PHMEG_0008777 [Phytophthora megakarya]|uniref:Uncharacterized protein n=1 Tax=Phytophthora megakarya TaxID=4795 RepID=A0A225WIP0_9STRA|nr:LOW QUALITY PROTEIN: hypothetical protein PHMEG_0008777 [Phytophthora megakarya]
MTNSVLKSINETLSTVTKLWREVSTDYASVQAVCTRQSASVELRGTRSEAYDLRARFSISMYWTWCTRQGLQAPARAAEPMIYELGSAFQCTGLGAHGKDYK